MFRTHQHFVVWAVASTFTKLDLPILSYSIIKLFRCGSEARCHRGVPSQSPPTWTSDPIDISCLASYQTQESQERPTMSTLTASSIYKDTVRNPPMVNTHQATNSKNKLQAIARGHTFLVWSVACLPLCACAFFFCEVTHFDRTATGTLGAYGAMCTGGQSGASLDDGPHTQSAKISMHSTRKGRIVCHLCANVNCLTIRYPVLSL